jgi:hypothetical protein
MQILLLQLSRASNALSRKPLSSFTSVSFSLGESSACLRSSHTDILLQLSAYYLDCVCA